jgi:hypothetical protein
MPLIHAALSLADADWLQLVLPEPHSYDHIVTAPKTGSKYGTCDYQSYLYPR